MVSVPYEVCELAKGISALKIVTFVINLASVVHLVCAKRLFGVRGGGKAERARQRRDSGRQARDSGRQAIGRATPKPGKPGRRTVRRRRTGSGPPGRLAY